MMPAELPRHQRGVALLAAIILMLALVTTMGTIFYRHQLELESLAGDLHGQQARLLALSAENWAGSLLMGDMDDPEVDHLEENWAMPLPPLPVEGGQLSGCLVDLQSRLNLNSFAAWDADSWTLFMEPDSHTPGHVLQGLMRAQELPVQEVQIASLVDWVDGNEQPLNQWGAEQAYYDTLRPRYMVSNGPLHEVSELAVIRGFDPAIVAALRPWLTTLPAVTTINVNTAQPGLLLAMGGEHGEAFVEAVMAQRPFESLTAFHEQMTIALQLDDEEAGDYWSSAWTGVNSRYFALEMRVELGEAVIDMTSVLERRGEQAPVVIRRSLSRVPDVDMNALDEAQRELLRHACENRQVRDEDTQGNGSRDSSGDFS